MTTSPQNAQYFIHKKSGKIHIIGGCGFCNKGANYHATYTLDEAFAYSQKTGASTAGMCAKCERIAKNRTETHKSFNFHVQVR